MTPCADTLTVIDRTKRVAATATTLVAILLPGGSEILPSRYHVLNQPLQSCYQWEVKDNQYLISEAPEEFWEHDIVVNMPPKRQYLVYLKIEKATKGEPKIILPEA